MKTIGGLPEGPTCSVKYLKAIKSFQSFRIHIHFKILQRIKDLLKGPHDFLNEYKRYKSLKALKYFSKVFQKLLDFLKVLQVF